MKIKHDFFLLLSQCVFMFGIAVFSVWLILCVVDEFHLRSSYVS